MLNNSHIFALQKLEDSFFKVVSGELPTENLTKVVGEETSHILWLAGHTVLALDLFFQSPLTGERILAESYYEKFMTGTIPAPEEKNYPTLEEIKDGFKKVIAVLRKKIISMTDEELLKPFPADSMTARFSPTPDALLHNALFHTAYHLGQISILRKAQGLESSWGY